MKAQTLLMMATTLVLLGAVLPMQNVSAHTCLRVDGITIIDFPATGNCDPYNCPANEYHDHSAILPDFPPDVDPVFAGCFSTYDDPLCPGQPTHNYGSGSSVGAESTTAQQAEGLGLVTVWHANANDCNGDGIPGGWDGDYENGIGGGFFGWGPWADEPICNYDLNVHGGNVAVNDIVFGSAISFVVGEGDQSGPIFVTDPTTNEVIDCETDGSITPSIDSDDCLSPTYVGTGSTCGPGGGDGGYWVFLDGFIATENTGITTNNPPTTGTITAF